MARIARSDRVVRAAGSRASPAHPQAPAIPAATDHVLTGLMIVTVLLVVLVILESVVWPDQMWGAHFYAFYPAPLLWIAAAVTLAAIVFAWRLPEHDAASPPAPLARRTRRITVAIATIASGVAFWLLRERHLFWGDALPLTIDLPKGETFHPNEPLTMAVHHLIYRLGGGHWSAATAVAIGSVVAGMTFVGWSAGWFTRRFRDPLVAAIACAILLAQGFVTLFFGHVEDYSYVAVALLVFFTTGIDFLEGRRGLLVPLLIAILATAFHILGGLTLIPAAVLMVVGLRDPARRKNTIWSVATSAALIVVVGIAVAGLYPGHAPWAGLFSVAGKVLSRSGTLRMESWDSGQHWANVWSQFQLLGPLSLPWLAIVLVMLATSWFRDARAWFLALGAAALLGPRLMIGEGALGAARDWDIFAGPAMVAPLAGLVLLGAALGNGRSRKLFVALLAVSLFHTVPWIAINTDVDRTMERIARLPLTNGRGETMIGMYHLNRGDVVQAEQWFRRAIERDPLNCNSQSGLGLALARQNRIAEAVGPMSVAVRLRPTVITFKDDLITALLSLERWSDAADVLRDRLVREPSHAPSWMMLAECRSRAGDDLGSITVLETASRWVGSDPGVHGALAEAYERTIVAYAKQGEFDRARVLFARFVVAFPGDPRVARLQAAGF